MNAVGDAGDRNFVNRHAGPDIFPKRPAYLAVQFAHAVGVPAHAQRENCHVECIGRMDTRLPESKKFVEWNLQFPGKTAEIFSHRFARERIIASRHRCVRSENVGRSDNLQRGIKIHLALDDIEANAFEREER